MRRKVDPRGIHCVRFDDRGKIADEVEPILLSSAVRLLFEENQPGAVQEHDVAGPRVTIRPSADLPLLHLDEPRLTGPERSLKRAVDVVVSCALLVVKRVFLEMGRPGMRLYRAPIPAMPLSVRISIRIRSVFQVTDLPVIHCLSGGSV